MLSLCEGPRRPRALLLEGARVALVLLGLLGAHPSAAATENVEPLGVFEPSEDVPEIWTRLANEYVVDPKAAAPRMIELYRSGTQDLPPGYRIVLADAYLRTGQLVEAQRLFAEVRESAPGSPWNEFASLGLGAAEMIRGNAAAAEVHFADVLNSPERSAHALGNLGRGQALLADGRPEEARAAFDAAAANAVVDPEYRQAGSFGSALARHAAGDSEGAVAALEALAESDPDGPLSRDARYAAARIRLETGEREAGIAALQELLARCDEAERSGRVSRSLRRLDARAVGRAWLRNYQETPWFRLQGRGTTMYTVGPCQLGRSTLREVGVTDLAPPNLVQVGAGAEGVTDAGADARLPGDVRVAQPAARAEPERAGGGSRAAMWILGLAALALLVVVWRLRTGRG